MFTVNLEGVSRNLMKKFTGDCFDLLIEEGKLSGNMPPQK